MSKPEGFEKIKRVLIVGYGSIGQRHIRLARGLLPDADIRVLRHQPNCESPELSNGIYSNIDEAINFAPQIAVIANPTSHHVPIAQALIERGVHLLIEKPVSNELVGITKLLQTQKVQKTVILVGYNLRYLPSLQHFRALLGAGIVGKVISVRCESGQYLPSWRPGSDYRHGVSANRELGGGVLLELSHEIDYLRWIFGEVSWVRATLSHQSSLELDVEDTVHMIIGFSSLYESNQLIGSLNLDFIRHDTTRLCTAIGEYGSLRWDGVTGQVMLCREDENVWKELLRCQHHRDDSYLAEWKNFLDCVIENGTPLITGEDGLKVLEIIEAARSSMASGNQVSVIETWIRH